MLQDTSRNKWQRFLPVAIGAILAIALVGIPGGRALLARALRSLRMQKVQAVNVNLSAFTDPNANPALHQMIAQMISDDVVVADNEPDQPAADATVGAELSGFDVPVVGERKDQRWDRGATVFLNSHPLSEIEVTCDQVAFIRDGEIVTTRDLRDREEEKIRLTVPARKLVPETISGLARWAICD